MWIKVGEGGSNPKYKLRLFLEAENLGRQIKMGTTPHLTSSCSYCTSKQALSEKTDRFRTASQH